jgi:uncharacterized Zn-finger protein
MFSILQSKRKATVLGPVQAFVNKKHHQHRQEQTNLIKSEVDHGCEKPHACEYDGCEKRFARKGSLKMHQLTHTGEMSYACDHEGCEKRFARNGSLTRHHRTHTGEKPYKCDHEGCGKHFSTSGGLKQHQRTHMGQKPYACDHAGCGKRFRESDSLKQHQRLHTGEKPYSCGYAGCGKCFAQRGNLTTHLRTHTGEQPYACDQDGCAKRFSESSSLKTHRRTHTGERAYVCDHDRCGKCFSERGHLVTHQRTHTGQKPYACDHDGCGKYFATSSHMVTHQRTHTGQKPYVCDHDGCGKGFSQSGSLKNHLRTHTGEQPYACEDCGKCFSVGGNLRKHTSLHQDQQTWKHVCQHVKSSVQLKEAGDGLFACEKRFPTEAAFAHHIKRHHTQEGHQKWPRESEQRLADFFTSKGIPFDRDRVNHISFTACKATLEVEEHQRAFPDFHLFSASEMLGYPVVLICCNDENQHRRVACEFKRVWSIFHALRQVPAFQEVPVVMIRFNPHPYKKNGVQFAPKMATRHAHLLETIQGLKGRREELNGQAPNLIYMYYDYSSTDGEAGADQLEVFRQSAVSSVDRLNADNLRVHVIGVIG